MNLILIIYSKVNQRQLLFHRSFFDLSVEEKVVYSNGAEYKDILWENFVLIIIIIRNRKCKPTFLSADKKWTLEGKKKHFVKVFN